MVTPPPTKESFDKLLLCLNPDRERAGEEYELLRLKLMEYFRVRACSRAEELADEALNRLAKKIADGEEIRNIRNYCYGMARLIWLEYLKNPGPDQNPYDDNNPEPSFTPNDFLIEKERMDCYQHCLHQITEAGRELITEYTDHDNRAHYQTRKELAERLGITTTALRIRISRIRDKLEACFSECMEKGIQKMK